jgi:hypothetical protein
MSDTEADKVTLGDIHHEAVQAGRDGIDAIKAALAGPTTSTLVSERQDPYEEGKGEWDWPYPDKYLTYLIGGNLAALILRRFGAAPGTPVLIEEKEVSSGYSEYTQETEYYCTVRAGEHSKSFGYSSSSVVGAYGNSLSRFTNWLSEVDS